MVLTDLHQDDRRNFGVQLAPQESRLCSGTRGTGGTGTGGTGTGAAGETPFGIGGANLAGPRV